MAEPRSWGRRGGSATTGALVLRSVRPSVRELITGWDEVLAEP